MNPTHTPLQLDGKSELTVVWTFSVTFEPGDKSWGKRWASYFSSTSETAELHWVSVTYSFVVAIGLAGLIAVCITITNIIYTFLLHKHSLVSFVVTQTFSNVLLGYTIENS